MALWRPVLSDPPLCTLRELQDGTYSMADLLDMLEGLDARDEAARIARRNAERDAKR